MPIEVPSYTINKNCASSSKAVANAAAMIMAGKADMMIAVGMESMSTTPFLLRGARYGYRMGNGVATDLLTEVLYDMGNTAERLAVKYNLTREELDAFAVKSQEKAAKAWADNVFAEELIPFTYTMRGKEYTISKDEGFKPGTTMETLAKLRPSFQKDGIVTAGNSSTINDGAAAILIVSEEKMKALGLKPMAEIIDFASAGVDPKIMGIGPVPASRKVMERNGLTVKDIDVWELNEAFAAQALSCIKELKLEPYMDRINLMGSGISLGHPVGATGSILTTKMVHYMKRNPKAKYGIITMCIGGGQGLAMLLKNAA